MYFIVFAAIIVVASASKLYSENEKFNREAFNEFKAAWNKKYPSVGRFVTLGVPHGERVDTSIYPTAVTLAT